MIVDSAFLFSDIEGSTRLWELFPEAMQRALARHDELMREVLAAHGGDIFKTIGDAFCVRFQTARQAVEAAVAIQQALHAEDWPAETPIRVRMGIHAGPAESRDDDFFGSTLNRTARIMGAGHGSQVLASAEVESRVSGLSLPFTFQTLGVHRLRDLQRSSEIFQVNVPGLAADFPPIRTMESMPSNLPQFLGAFVGRQREMARLREEFGQNRLVTIVGPGGCGKTRISVEFAAERLDSFPGGVWIIELAKLQTEEELSVALCEAMNLRVGPEDSPDRALQSQLSGGRTLLLLDNCEHMLDAVARWTERALRQFSTVRVLSTSREPIGINGEAVFRLSSLGLPDENATKLSDIIATESVRMFLDRVAAVSPDFVPVDAHARSIAQICLRLDGIPLALELAASRVRAMPLDALVDRLDDRFKVLTGGSRTALPKHQTLKALIEWSHELLEDDAKILFRRLAVFAGGWRIEEAERVSDFDPWDTLDHLTKLVDRSLVVFDEQRYRFLETIREYALLKLRESGEEEEVAQRHAQAFVQLSEEAEPHLSTPEANLWMNTLDQERKNLHKAVETLVAQPDGQRQAMAMVGRLIWFWDVRAHWSESVALLERSITAYGDGPPCPELLGALRAWGLLSLNLRRFTSAIEIFERNRQVAIDLGDPLADGRAIHNLGLAHMRRGEDLAAAKRLFEEAIPIMEAQSDSVGLCRAYSNLALTSTDLGDLDAATALYGKSLKLSKEVGDERSAAIALNNLGTLQLSRGDVLGAIGSHRQALEIRLRINETSGIAASKHNLAQSLLHQSRLDEAAELLAEAWAIRREASEIEAQIDLLESYAFLALAQGRAELGCNLIGCAEEQRSEHGIRRHAVDQSDMDHLLSLAREAAPEDMDEWIAAGRKWTLAVDPRPYFIVEGTDEGVEEPLGTC
ncbi:MAG: tetratricopeptide repeat protein [Armatimonadetes bacterium]|nr:tetratricopeptide repeat protein [Armatimonadota bacterium]